jgi:hypothetical protein
VKSVRFIVSQSIEENMLAQIGPADARSRESELGLD